MSSNDRRKKCLRLSRKGYWLRVAPIALICIGLAGSVRAFIELKRSDELIESTAIAAIVADIIAKSFYLYYGNMRLNDLTDGSKWRLLSFPFLFLIFASMTANVIAFLPATPLLGCEHAACVYALDKIQELPDWLGHFDDANYIFVLIIGIIPGYQGANSFGDNEIALARASKLAKDAKLRDLLELHALNKLSSRQTIVDSRGRFTSKYLQDAGLARDLGMLRSYVLAKALTAIGFICLFLLAFAVNSLRNYNNHGNVFRTCDWSATCFLTITFVAFYCVSVGVVAWACLHFSQKIMQKFKNYKAIYSILLGDTTILYLRPFASDGRLKVSPSKLMSGKSGFHKSATQLISTSLVGPTYFHTLQTKQAMDIVHFDSYLEKELEDIGTVSAIGLDTPGIAHISTLDDEWETTMRNLSERAGCIIYVPGYSEGAVKEFQHIIDHALYKTLIISVPSTGGLPVAHLLGKRKDFNVWHAWSLWSERLIKLCPEADNFISQLEYRSAGALYHIRPGMLEVEEYEFTAPNLRNLVGQMLRSEPSVRVVKSAEP